MEEVAWGLRPRWVRAATVGHGHGRSPAVADGSEELQVAAPSAQAAGRTQTGDQIVLPKGGVRVPSVPPPSPQLSGRAEASHVRRLRRAPRPPEPPGPSTSSSRGASGWMTAWSNRYTGYQPGLARTYARRGRLQHGSPCRHRAVKPSRRTFELQPKLGRCDDQHVCRVTHDTTKLPGTCYDGHW